MNQKEYINSIASGATIKEVRPSKLLESLYLPLPPLGEQEKIVASLDAIEKSIKSAEELIENLKAEGGDHFFAFQVKLRILSLLLWEKFAKLTQESQSWKILLKFHLLIWQQGQLKALNLNTKKQERYPKYLRDTLILQKMMSYLQKLHLALRMENAELQLI